MRIVGGNLGGRVLKAPRGDATRPTSEKVREALFAILGPPPDGALVLDLFAGAGGLGLEALSRGAAHVTFVDASRPALAALRHNVAVLGVAAQSSVVPGDALRLLPTLRPPTGAAWTWVFLDPPYRSDLAVRAAAALPRDALTALTSVVIEHDRRNAPPDEVGSLLRTDERRYGDTLISFYRPLPEPPL